MRQVVLFYRFLLSDESERMTMVHYLEFEQTRVINKPSFAICRNYRFPNLPRS